MGGPVLGGDDDAVRAPGVGLDWRAFARGVDLFSLPLIILAAALAASFDGLHGVLSAIAGAALLLADLHVLAWLVASALGGRMSQRAVVYAVVPFKFLALAGLVFAAIVVVGLEPMAFAGGITAVVTAILAAAARRMGV